MLLRRGSYKNGLALSSGASRGLAHIGVIEYLLEQGIEFDIIAGSSIGALVGAYFALNGDITGLKEFALKVNRDLLFNLSDINIFKVFQGAISEGKMVDKILERLFGQAEFADLKIPLIVCATDIMTGRPVRIKKGKIKDAVRASITVPGILPIVRRGRSVLIDGGVSIPVPIAPLKRLKVKRIYASNVITAVPALNNIFPFPSKQPDEKNLNLLSILLKTLFTMEYSLATTRDETVHCLITPATSSIHIFDFTCAKQMIEAGRQAAQNALKRTKRGLGLFRKRSISGE